MRIYWPDGQHKNNYKTAYVYDVANKIQESPAVAREDVLQLILFLLLTFKVLKANM